jgi:transposase
MTIHATIWYPIPAATAATARTAFPKGNRYLTLADQLGTRFWDPEFADLSVQHGRPAESPARLALVLVRAQLEGWSDVEAADVVRARLDWTHLLAVPLDDP